MPLWASHYLYYSSSTNKNKKTYSTVNLKNILYNNFNFIATLSKKLNSKENFIGKLPELPLYFIFYPICPEGIQRIFKTINTIFAFNMFW